MEGGMYVQYLYATSLDAVEDDVGKGGSRQEDLRRRRFGWVEVATWARSGKDQQIA